MNNIFARKSIPRRGQQSGAVLFIAMVFLLILTVLAIAASSSSILQERMTGGMRNRQLSLMGAETTLRGGEEFLWTLNFNESQPLPPCIEGGSAECAYFPNSDGLLMEAPQRFRTSKEWLDPATDGARAYSRDLSTLSGDDITARLASAPRFIIEMVGDDGDDKRFIQVGSEKPETTSGVGVRKLYRITARSQGGSGAVISVAESVFSSMDLTNTGTNPEGPTSPASAP